MNMTVLQSACVVIVASYLWLRVRTDGPAVFARLAVLALASWIAEDSAIHLYGFYSYARGWSLFVDRVPLLIVLIWPVVIDSGSQLARAMVGERRSWLALTTGLVVLTDASLIEPIATHAGLWTWTEPGLFAVPPIGILGWAFFAAGAAALIRPGVRGLVQTVVGTQIVTHALLLATWWGALRWVNHTMPDALAIAGAWLLCTLSTAAALRSGAADRVPRIELWVRLPGALFFFVLLARDAPRAWWLVAYAIPFALPYLGVLARGPSRSFSAEAHRARAA
jgi:hypothetical protein